MYLGLLRFKNFLKDEWFDDKIVPKLCGAEETIS